MPAGASLQVCRSLTKSLKWQEELYTKLVLKTTGKSRFQSAISLRFFQSGVVFKLKRNAVEIK